MSKEGYTAYAWVLMYRAAGFSDVDAVIKGINEVAHTWYEYARIYNEIKEEL